MNKHYIPLLALLSLIAPNISSAENIYEVKTPNGRVFTDRPPDPRYPAKLVVSSGRGDSGEEGAQTLEKLKAQREAIDRRLKQRNARWQDWQAAIAKTKELRDELAAKFPDYEDRQSLAGGGSKIRLSYFQRTRELEDKIAQAERLEKTAREVYFFGESVIQPPKQKESLSDSYGERQIQLKQRYVTAVEARENLVASAHEKLADLDYRLAKVADDPTKTKKYQAEMQQILDSIKSADEAVTKAKGAYLSGNKTAD